MIEVEWIVCMPSLYTVMNEKNDRQSEMIKKLQEENKQLKKRLDKVLKELYCKDRKLEELGESIECCDKQ